MSFWEFLDRNPEVAILGGFFIFGTIIVVAGALSAFGRCG